MERPATAPAGLIQPIVQVLLIVGFAELRRHMKGEFARSHQMARPIAWPTEPGLYGPVATSLTLINNYTLFMAAIPSVSCHGTSRDPTLAPSNKNIDFTLNFQVQLIELSDWYYAQTLSGDQCDIYGEWLSGISGIWWLLRDLSACTPSAYDSCKYTDFMSVPPALIHCLPALWNRVLINPYFRVELHAAI